MNAMWISQRKSLFVAIAMGLLIVVAIVIGLVLSGGKASAAGHTTANVWIVDSGGTAPCTRQPTAVDFTSAPSNAKCSTFQAAYNAMNAGDRAIVRSGTYANGDVTSNSLVTKSPAPTIEVETGGLAYLTNGATYAGIDGLVVDGTTGVNQRGLETITGNAFEISSNGSPRTSNLILKGVSVHDTPHGDTNGQVIYMTNCTNITLADMDFENIWKGDGIQMSTFNGHSGSCDGVTMDNVNMRDFTCPGTEGDHQDFLQILAGSNTIVQNSRWVGLHCDYVSGPPSGSQGWFISNGFDPTGVNHSFINSVVADVDGAALSLYTADGIVIKNSTIDGGVGTETTPEPVSNVVMQNNIIRTGSGGCYALSLLHDEIASGGWKNNVTTADCGYSSEGDTVASSWSGLFVDVANFDYHLTANSDAIGKADVATSTAADLEGNDRDNDPDAGAYEYGAGALVGDLNGDGHVNTADVNLLKTDYGKLVGAAVTPGADLNADGKITIKDLSLMLKGWTG